MPWQCKVEVKGVSHLAKHHQPSGLSARGSPVHCSAAVCFSSRFRQCSAAKPFGRAVLLLLLLLRSHFPAEARAAEAAVGLNAKVTTNRHIHCCRGASSSRLGCLDGGRDEKSHTLGHKIDTSTHSDIYGSYIIWVFFE